MQNVLVKLRKESQILRTRGATNDRNRSVNIGKEIGEKEKGLKITDKK